MTSWNTIKVLKMGEPGIDDSDRTEAAKRFVEHFLKASQANAFDTEACNPAQLFANAVREVIQLSKWGSPVIVEQIGYLLCSIDRPDGDERICICEPDDEMLGPPVLMIAIEELAVADGSLQALDKQQKVPPQPANPHVHRLPTVLGQPTPLRLCAGRAARAARRTWRPVAAGQQVGSGDRQRHADRRGEKVLRQVVQGTRARQARQARAQGLKANGMCRRRSRATEIQLY